MKMPRFLPALAAAAALGFPLLGAAAGPKLQIPDFSHLRSKAVESTDITLDGLLMNLARKFAAADHDGDDEALSILSDIQSLRVRNFETTKLKVNDANSNPIEIGAIVVWKVVETAEASFEVDDTFPQQIQIRPPVHLPLEHLDPIHMPFDRPGVVHERQAGSDRIEVSA